MLSRTMRLTASVIAGVALSFAGVGVAEASHGADNPPGHEANHHHGHHHHHGGYARSHGADDGVNHDAGHHHHHGHGANDGPNHH